MHGDSNTSSPRSHFEKHDPRWSLEANLLIHHLLKLASLLLLSVFRTHPLFSVYQILLPQLCWKLFIARYNYLSSMPSFIINSPNKNVFTPYPNAPLEHIVDSPWIIVNCTEVGLGEWHRVDYIQAPDLGFFWILHLKAVRHHKNCLHLFGALTSTPRRKK